MCRQSDFEKWLNSEGTIISRVTMAKADGDGRQPPTITLHLASEDGDAFDVIITLNRKAKHKHPGCECGCEFFGARIEGIPRHIKGNVSYEANTGERGDVYLSCEQKEERHEFSVRAVVDDAIIAIEYKHATKPPQKTGASSSNHYRRPTHKHRPGGVVHEGRRRKILQEIANRSKVAANPDSAK